MANRKKRTTVSAGDVNMTPMIDIVFQMIIFFVCTVQLEKTSVLETIELAMSPHGPIEEVTDPRTVRVDVDGDGVIHINRTPLSLAQFRAVMQKTVAASGRSVPVVIRGDSATRHEHIRRVMDACKQAGLWKVKFAAIKDKAT